MLTGHFPPCFQEYPLLPPALKFITPMWHPNGMFESGSVLFAFLMLILLVLNPFTASLLGWKIVHLDFGENGQRFVGMTLSNILTSALATRPSQPLSMRLAKTSGDTRTLARDGFPYTQ